ncbi:hypothetical protein [Treponema sp. R6D11]
MKKIKLTVFVVLISIVSCVTGPKNDPYYASDKQDAINKIEEYLKYPKQEINLDFYLYRIENIYGEKSAYYKDFFKDVYEKYEPAVSIHNTEAKRLIAEEKRQNEEKYNKWLALTKKKISGSKDWEEFQRKYNLAVLYRSLLGENTSTSRLRLELFMKDMDNYIKDKKLIFNEEQKEWVDQIKMQFISLSLALNINFGMNDLNFKYYVRQEYENLAKDNPLLK